LTAEDNDAKKKCCYIAPVRTVELLQWCKQYEHCHGIWSVTE